MHASNILGIIDCYIIVRIRTENYYIQLFYHNNMIINEQSHQERNPLFEIFYDLQSHLIHVLHLHPPHTRSNPPSPLGYFFNQYNGHVFITTVFTLFTIKTEYRLGLYYTTVTFYLPIYTVLQDISRHKHNHFYSYFIMVGRRS